MQNQNKFVWNSQNFASPPLELNLRPLEGIEYWNKRISWKYWEHIVQISWNMRRYWNLNYIVIQSSYAVPTRLDLWEQRNTFLKMPLTVDDVLEQIGGFEKYQLLLLFMFGYVAITLDSFPTMIVTFITAEPDWVCVQGNNSKCNFTDAISLTSSDYMARCDMPRESWTYAAGFTSTVTEVVTFVLFVMLSGSDYLVTNNFPNPD